MQITQNNNSRTARRIKANTEEAKAPQENAEAEAAPEAPVDAKAEPSTKEKLHDWFFNVRRKGDKLVGAPYHKLTYGAVLAAGAWTAYNVATDIASAATPLGIAGKVALNGAALVGGYLAADVASGMMHHWADQYADPNSGNKHVRKFAKQSQRHHFFPSKLGNYTPSYWAQPLSLVAWAPLVAVSALGAPGPLMSATLGLVGGTTHYGNFHNWAHMRKSDIPAVGKFLQKTGIAIGRKTHGQHHALPWNSDYCIVSGAMNKPLNAIEFWPKYEKLVHKVTGKEAESWKQKDYKEYIDGKITREEYIDRRKEVRKDFMQNHRERIREKWDIRG